MSHVLGPRDYRECVSSDGGPPLEKRDIIRNWSAEDWRELDRWLQANAIIGSPLAAGLVAMAVAGFPAGPDDTGTARNR